MTVNIDLNNITFNDAMKFIESSVGAVIAIDSGADCYKALLRQGFFSEYLGEAGSYNELIEKLWFHFNNSPDSVIEDYHVFIPTSGKFIGKYSKRINLSFHDITHVVQMTIYPMDDEGRYLLILDELDGSQYVDESLTHKKVSTIQNTYLFSMYADIVRDTINSISVTEISDEVMNQQLKYSEWRLMIVNMIWPEDQSLFLQRTDPDYLKANLAPGRSSSFDCLMMNLEGKYIWVKLIFSRAETNNEDDFRFVFMVQDINENYVELMSTLKKYEDLALKDTLTALFNHGRIETEINNAIDSRRKNGGEVTLMLIDIDFFKRVNDEFGHAIGDVTLVHFANTISSFIEDKNAVAGRWGGEEFVVVLYGMNEADSMAAAEAFRQKIEKEHFKCVCNLTCSIGITNIKDADDTDTAFNRMDKALYEAKSAGRNCVKLV